MQSDQDKLPASLGADYLAGVELFKRGVSELRRVIASDGFAASFQSLGGYRSALLARLDALPVPAPVPAAAVLVCPFCGGPPCPFVGNAHHPYGAAAKLDDYGDDGLLVQAHVFCHSCGSEGPMFEGTLYSRDDYLRATQLAITSWNKRGVHPELEVRQWEAL